MKFKDALFQLTAVYLTIIMVICLFFSLELYRVSTNELAQSYHRQSEIIRKDWPGLRGLLLEPQYLKAREANLAEGKQRIFMQLVYVNMAILGVAGLASYLLAKRTLRPIEEAHEAQSRFTADASHELRTPLAAMRTEIEVALRNKSLGKTEAVDLLKSNLEELQKLGTLSDELLKLARLEGDDLPKRLIAVNKIEAEALRRVLPLAEQKKILIVQKGSQHAQVMGDAASLTEVLVILLDNAIKYSPEKSEITLEVRKQTKNTMLLVRDHGTGIKAKDLPHIFERFYRADASRTQSQTHGYGLGLSIAKRIVDLHGGRIIAHSDLGKGTTFRVILPNTARG